MLTAKRVYTGRAPAFGPRRGIGRTAQNLEGPAAVE
jgi:hypothetical protein